MKTPKLITLACTSVLLCSLPVAATQKEPDPDIQAIQPLAEQGDPEAQFQLGRAYMRGLGIVTDTEKGVALFQESAAQGHSRAMASLGYVYLEGMGVQKDEKLAAEWFRKAAEEGNLVGILSLGLLTREGRGVEQSNEEGLRLMHKAADAGSEEAALLLGELYFRGDDHQQPDRAKAVKLIVPLAESGNPRAQNILGVATRDGLGGIPPSRDGALLWFRRAAEQNERRAQANLGHLLSIETASPDRAEALKWLLLASEQGEPTSKRTLAELGPLIPAALMVKARADVALYKSKLKDDADRATTSPAPQEQAEVKTDEGTVNTSPLPEVP